MELNNQEPAQDSPVSPSDALETPAASATPSVEVAGDAPAADPAPAEAAPKSGMLDIVKNVLGLNKKPEDINPPEKADSPAAAVSPAPAEENQQAAGAAEAPAKATEVPKEIAEHPAFQALQQENESFRDAATRFNAIQEVGNKFGVLPEEFSQGLNLTVMSKADPEAFYQKICEIQESFALALGKKLPEDLQDDLDSGLITEERAKELATARVRANAAEKRNENFEQQEIKTARAQNQSLVDQWFSQAAKTDINLDLKIDAITRETVKILDLEKTDRSNKAAVLAVLDRAHKTVNARFAGARQVVPVQASPASSASVGKSPAAGQPKNEILNSVREILSRESA